ncbi:MAG: site-specific DNA-methyltransferase [Rubrivivax sp.]|nr:MAG: site-specific DNA-methyltransferase [Rubrivivax sp.]
MTAVTILHGDCIEQMRTLADQSVHCCVTSPPYFGLRDYGVPPSAWPAVDFVPVAGLPPMTVPAMTCCLGLEADPWAFVAHLVLVFREVRRVLRRDGTLWLNLGDSYAGSGRGGYPGERGTLAGTTEGQDNSRVARDTQRTGCAQRENAVTAIGTRLPAGLHEAVCDAGAAGRHWVSPQGGLKNKDLIGIPWRVACALQADGWVLRQDVIWAKPNPMPESVRDRCTKAHEYLFLLSKGPRYYFDHEEMQEPSVSNNRALVKGAAVPHNTLQSRLRLSVRRGGFAGKTNAMPGREAFRAIRTTRNRRSVWTVATRPYAGAHFAVFPPDLIKPCVRAGCPEGGVVLDPFGGSGTTAAVAVENGRSAVICELNGGYLPLQHARIATAQATADQAAAEAATPQTMDLFENTTV